MTGQLGLMKHTQLLPPSKIIYVFQLLLFIWLTIEKLYSKKVTFRMLWNLHRGLLKVICI